MAGRGGGREQVGKEKSLQDMLPEMGVDGQFYEQTVSAKY